MASPRVGFNTRRARGSTRGIAGRRVEIAPPRWRLQPWYLIRRYRIVGPKNPEPREITIRGPEGLYAVVDADSGIARIVNDRSSDLPVTCEVLRTSKYPGPSPIISHAGEPSHASMALRAVTIGVGGMKIFGCVNFALAGDPKELWIVPGARHRGLREAAGPEYDRRVLAFLEKHAAP